MEAEKQPEQQGLTAISASVKKWHKSFLLTYPQAGRKSRFPYAQKERRAHICDPSDICAGAIESADFY